MIDIRLLYNNNIVTLEIPTKAIIKSSSGLYHASPLELLCVSVGSCIGKHIVKHCTLEKININEFESIQLDYDSDKFIVYIKHPKYLTKQQKLDLVKIIKTCDISKLLKPEIIVKFKVGKIVKVKTKSTGCCGG